MILYCEDPVLPKILELCSLQAPSSRKPYSISSFDIWRFLAPEMFALWEFFKFSYFRKSHNSKNDFLWLAKFINKNPHMIWWCKFQWVANNWTEIPTGTRFKVFNNLFSTFFQYYALKHLTKKPNMKFAFKKLMQ